jgi:hypothetical protein
MFKTLKRVVLAGLAVVSVFVATAAQAAVDVSTLTASVDFSTVITAILAVAAIMVGVYVAWKASKMVIGAVKGL